MVPGNADRTCFGRNTMQDLMWIAVTIVFFVLSIAYVYFCERVK